jgi:hypothetical protein
MQIFQIPITQLKSPNQNGVTICTTVHDTYNSYKISLNFAQGFCINRMDKHFNGNISKSHNSVKNHWTRTGLRNAQILVHNIFINPTKIYENPTKGFWRNTVNKMFNWNISKSHNSAKNQLTRPGLQYAQQGMVLIIRTKFYWSSTKGFG